MAFIVTDIRTHPLCKSVSNFVRLGVVFLKQSPQCMQIRHRIVTYIHFHAEQLQMKKSIFRYVLQAWAHRARFLLRYVAEDQASAAVDLSTKIICNQLHQ